MKKFGKSKAREMWENLMHSTQKKISCGASQVLKAITWARGDNWRRKQKQLKGEKRHGHRE